MKKAIFAGILAMAFAVSSFASATTTGQFLKLGVGGQATAMGEAVTALVSDSTAVYWNPAGLNRVQNSQLTLMHDMYVGDVFYDFAAYAVKMGDMGVFGLGVQYLNYGAITQTDASSNDIGSFTPYDMAFTISYARKVSDINVGVSVKYVMSKIINTASAFAFDVGAQYSFDRFLLGAMVSNIGTQMKFIDEATSLPMLIKLGVGYKLMDNLILEVDGNLPSDSNLVIGGGAEYKYALSADMGLNLRAGYNTRTADITGFKGFSFGLGFVYQSYVLDYAIIPYGDVGTNQNISLGVKF